MAQHTVQAIAFVGYSGSGKTTVIEGILPLLTARGLRVATVKHHHGEFEPDKPGKDSFRHRKAGASLTIVSSSQRLFLVEEFEREPTIGAIIAHYAVSADLCIVEGFKGAKLPKIEVLRKGVSPEMIFQRDPMVAAVISDDPVEAPIPVFGTKDLNAIVQFITERLFPGGVSPR
jgi:molybdopterin-guanine dinucleotide biosynthesis adapter protein